MKQEKMGEKQGNNGELKIKGKLYGETSQVWGMSMKHIKKILSELGGCNKKS